MPAVTCLWANLSAEQFFLFFLFFFIFIFVLHLIDLVS